MKAALATDPIAATQARFDEARSDSERELAAMEAAVESMRRDLPSILDEWQDEHTAPGILRILVIDDDANLCSVFVSALVHELHASVHGVNTVDAALHSLRLRVFDVVIVDVALNDPKGRTGLDIAASIPRSTAVILISGEVPDRLASLARPVNAAWITKPPQIVDLVRTVRAEVAKYHAAPSRH